MNLTISDTAIELGVFALDSEIEGAEWLEIYPAEPEIVFDEKQCVTAA